MCIYIYKYSYLYLSAAFKASTYSIYIHVCIHMAGPCPKPTSLYVSASLVGSMWAAIQSIYMYAHMGIILSCMMNISIFFRKKKLYLRSPCQIHRGISESSVPILKIIEKILAISKTAK